MYNGDSSVGKLHPSTHHLLNLSEAQPAPIFAFLTAQNCELNARGNL